MNATILLTTEVVTGRRIRRIAQSGSGLWLLKSGSSATTTIRRLGHDLSSGTRLWTLSSRLCRLAAVILGNLLAAESVPGQVVEITGLPPAGQAGQVSGVVSGIDFATHAVAATIYIDGSGWWTKPTDVNPTVPIRPDGTFEVNIGAGGVDGFASIYSVSVVPIDTPPPLLLGAKTHDLGTESVVATHQQRYGANLLFAGRHWGVKAADLAVGPGGNLFSDSPNDVIVDEDGLHLSIRNIGGQWHSSEVVLTETLGYGTYMFQTSSRQDIMNANATFGGFTWDPFGDDAIIPNNVNREIDFEDSRWGNQQNPFNSQVVVQPFDISGNLHSITLPDLSTDGALTRLFVWSPGRVAFYTLLGHHSPTSFTARDIIDHFVYLDDGGPHHVPEPGRENFHFNLWLNQPLPVGNQPVEVLVNDFLFIPLIAGDFDIDLDVDNVDLSQWEGDFGVNGDSDADSDGDSDGTDFLLWQQNVVASSSVSSETFAVPEPAGLSFISCVVLCSAVYRPARKSSGIGVFRDLLPLRSTP